MTKIDDNELDYLPMELRTQDNAITADPLFIVQEEERVYGVSTDYADGLVDHRSICKKKNQFGGYRRGRDHNDRAT